MPARSIGTATISFGLVSVPINIYSASESKQSISFNLLSRKSGTRVKQQYIDPKTNEIVPREEMVKGYEFAKDQYVVFTPDELKALEEKATSTIDTPSSSLDEVDGSISTRCTTSAPTRAVTGRTACSPRRSRKRAAQR
jgi:DNA end-binding protein Ku